MREHQAQGHVVAIVSGATKFVVRPLAARLGIKHILYTRLEVEDGRFTGRVIEPICFEEGKIYWLQQLIDEQRIDLAKSWFYTDSITDLPLLDLVGHPVAMNPDPRLYREAARRRWPVRFFTPPDAARLPPSCPTRPTDGRGRGAERGRVLRGAWGRVGVLASGSLLGGRRGLVMAEAPWGRRRPNTFPPAAEARLLR